MRVEDGQWRVDRKQWRTMEQSQRMVYSTCGVKKEERMEKKKKRRRSGVDRWVEGVMVYVEWRMRWWMRMICASWLI